MSKKILFTVLSFVFLSFSSKATILPYVKGMLTTPLAGTPAVVAGTTSATMSSYITPPTTGLSYVDVTKRGAVTLGVNHHHGIFTAQSVTEITVKVTRYPVLSGGAIADTNIVLRVSYYPNDSLNFDDKHTITFGLAEKFTAVITAIKVNGVTKTNLPVNLYLQGDVFVDRIYNFTTQSAVTPIFVGTATTQDLDCDTKHDQITIAWNPIIGAEEYQLEWVYINNLDKAASDLTVNFKTNSTRISTTGTSYSISLVFDKGFICYRVRGVGRSSAAGYQDRFIFTRWTTNDGNFLVSALGVNSKYQVTVPYEISKNWQYSTTYAEEGKKKEVVSFFDGSLRNRQMVTKINSDKNAVVGESIYDHMGRAAIQVLPTPVADPASCSAPDKQASLKYYPNYNKNLSNVAYSKADFDISGADSCNTTLSGMNTNSGSSNYYSNSNPDLTGAQAYLPDAEKFPFSQTQFMPDNTGRIRSQGGVGKDFQLGTGHETKYFYAHPFQEQLDRLFGSEVGDATHYQKNMVVAPNGSVSTTTGTPDPGQVSISYLDQEGRVIATSLAGNVPANVLPLPSAAAAAVSLTVDLFAKDKDGGSKSNNLSADGQSKEFNQIIALSSPTNLKIAYNISIPAFHDACIGNLCFNCVYDLRIEVRDLCGKLLSPVAISPRMTGHFTPAGTSINFLTSCNNYAFDTSFTIINLPVGTYQISKILTVNEEAIQAYLDMYLDTSANGINTCIDTYQEILNEITANSDIDNCDENLNCAECVTNLGSLQVYIEAGGTENDYYKELDDCNAPCRPISYYEVMRLQLRTDVSPGGQYGEYMNNQGLVAPGTFPLSVFNTGNSLPQTNANWRKPKYDVESTIQNFYFEEDGVTKSRVYLDNVTISSNAITTSTPALDPAFTYTIGVLAFLDPSTNTYYTYPQYLASVTNFISLYMGNPYWSNSLVIYHPEYPILKTYREFTVPVIAGENYTSESFDAAMMNVNTWTDAVTAGFIDSNYASLPVNDRLNNFFAASTTHPWDPFATHVNSIGMQNKVFANMSIGSTSYSMMEVAAMMTRCQTPYITSLPTTPCISWGDNYGSDPTAVRNAEWLTFRGLYMAAKQELQQNLARTRSLINSNYYGYNGCIGNDEYLPFTYGFAYINLGVSPFIFGQFLNPNQPCYFGNAEKYLHKEKRFGNPLEYVNSDPSQAAYQTYLATGKCPIAFSFEQLLSETAGMNLLASPGFTMDVLPTVTSLVMTMNNFAPPTGPMPSLDWNPITINSTELEVQLLESSVPFATFYLEKDGGSLSYNWSDIQYFQNIHYTGMSSSDYQFTIDAKVMIGGVLKTQHLTGTTTLEVGGCTFAEVCELNAVGKDLEKMLKTLAYMNTFSSTTSVNLNSSPYSTFLTGPIAYAINPVSSGTTTWKYVASPPRFELTNGSSTLTLGINSVSPGFSLSSIGMIASINKIKPGYYNSFEIVCSDASGNYLATLSCDAIRTANTFVPLSECGMPEPLLCEGTEYQTTEDLFKVLKFVLETQNAPFNLTGNSYWTSTLNSQISGYPTITGTTSAGGGKKLLTFTIPGGCNIVLASNNADNPTFLYDNILSVDSIKLIGLENGYGSYYNFRLKITYEYLSTTFERYLYGTSCFKLKECNNCTEIQIGVPPLPGLDYPSVSGTIPPSLQNYATRCEDIYNNYLVAYQNAIDQLTSDECTDPEVNFPVIPYQYFVDNNFCCESGFLEMTYFVLDVTAQYLGVEAHDCYPAYRVPQPVVCGEINESTSLDYCGGIYTQYVKSVLNINTWPDWGPASGIHLETADQSEYCCDCFANYMVYLLSYMTDRTSEGWTNIMSISDFCGQMNCFSDEPISNCENKYNQYLSFVTNYNTSIASPYQVMVMSSTEFNEAGLCACVDEYIARLNLILDGSIRPQTSPSLYEFCLKKKVIIPCVQNNPTVNFDNFEITYQDPCTEFYESNNETNAYITFNEQNQAFQTDISKRYIAHCMKAVESMKATYDDKEYHFTLYYYDQAGNLVKTVPPEGVELVNISDTIIRDSIKSDRKYGRQSVITNHRLATTYLYNSLNQLVGQNMPDQDPMQVLESTLTNGLPMGLYTTAIQMVNSNLGYLSGYINNTAVPMQTRGYLYRTNNGGQNWTRITNTLAANLKEIKMVSATQGFAIAQDGLFFISNDAGLNWDLVNTYSTGIIADLVALDASATDIYVLAKSGVIYKYPIGGAISAAITTYISAPTLPAGHTIVEYKDFVLPGSIVADGTGVVYVATVTNGSETFDVVSLNTAAVSTFENVQVADLGAISFYTATDGIIGGLDGNISLLKGVAGSYTQTMHTSGTLGTINQLIMQNSNIGLASITENGVTTIRKTADGGTTWTLLDLGFEEAKMALNKRTATTMEVLIQGSEVISSVAYSYSKTIFLNTAGIVSILEQTPNVHQALDLKVVSSYVDGSGNTFYFGIGADNKLYRSNPFTTMGDQVIYIPVNSTPPILPGGVIPKQMVSIKAGLGVSIYVLSTAGIVYRTNAPTPGGNYSAFIALGGPASIMAIDKTTSGGLNYVVGYNSSDNRVYFAESSAGVTSLYYFATSLTLGTSVITNIAVHGNQISVIGTNGGIFTSDAISSFPTSSGTTLNFTARQSHRLTRLVGVKIMPSELIVYGENGVVLTRSTAGTASTCLLKPMKTLEQINCVAPYASSATNFYLFAGDHGYLKAVNSSTWIIQPALYTTTGVLVSSHSQGDALRSIAVNNTSIYVVGDRGRAYYNENITTQAFIPVSSFSTDDLNSVAIINNQNNKAIAVGNNTTVTRFTGNFSTKGNQVFGPMHRDVHFANGQIGTVVGDHYLIRSTTDGGITWKINMPATFVAADINRMRKVWTIVSPASDHYAIIGGASFLGSANAGVFTKLAFGPTITDIQFHASTPLNGFMCLNGPIRRLTLVPSGSTYTFTPGTTNLGGMTGYTVSAIHVFENQSVAMAASSGEIYYYRPSTGTLSTLTTVAAGLRDIYFHDNTIGYAVGSIGTFSILTSSGLDPITREILTMSNSIQPIIDPVLGIPNNSIISCIAFGSRITGVYGGSYTNPANVTSSSAMVRTLKHEGGLYTSRFYYDRLGRVVLSQNSRQQSGTTTAADDKYAYTLYDALGRVVEGGEKSENSSGVKFPSVFGAYVGGSYLSSVINDMKMVSWLNNLAATTRKEITKSYYDKTNAAIGTEVTALSTLNTATQRKRIVHTTYSSVYSASSNVYDHATHYNYDIHGNVINLYQDNRLISGISGINQHRLKRMDYVYDLISGNVHRVDYETGKADQWHHVYDYDADNRVTTVFTSAQTPYTTTNSSVVSLQNEPLLSPFWDQDAEYGFYAHGPLARTILGDEQVQGIDNIYTLQGWLKGVNSERLNPGSDPGKDGTAFSSVVARDIYGFTLHYFTGDFKYVTTVSTANSFLGSQTGSDLISTANSYNLYSGNIARIVTSITEPNTRAVLPLGNAYKYDQLNRLRESKSFTNLNLTTNVWGTGGTISYRNAFTYDANGNIISQVRNDVAGVLDNLTYNYPQLSGKTVRNRLLYVTDGISGSAPTDDIESQLPGNYTYDAEGRLIGDVKEGITSITWRVDGKVAAVTNTLSGRKNLKFDYDAMGHRIAKHIFSLSNVLEKSVYYILDAQGNVMSVYERAVNVSQQNVSYIQIEKHIYGSNRLGINNKQVAMLGSQNSTFSMNSIKHQIGLRMYELTNHLGNVLSVISNKPLPHQNGSTVDYWLADIRQATDYSPFGVQLSARNIAKFSPGTSTPIANADGRYGFNGMEEDDEIKGEGNSYDFGARMHDPRIGRWLTIDPLAGKYPSISPYVFVANSPILLIDPNGKEIIISMEDEKFAKQAFADLQKLTNKQLVLLSNGVVLEKHNLSLTQKTQIVQYGTTVVVPNTTDSEKPFGTNLVHNAISSEKTVTISKQIEGGGNSTGYEDALAAHPRGAEIESNGQVYIGTGGGSNSEIKYDPTETGDGIVNEDGTTGRPPHVGLAHELGHAIQAMRGKRYVGKSNYSDPDGSPEKLKNEEYRTRVKVDNVIRKEQKVKKRAVPKP